MATSTTNYGLRKPDPADTVNVATDLNTPYDTIDTNLKRVDSASLADQTNRWHRQVDASFIFISGVGGTEVDIDKCKVTGVNVHNNYTYHFRARVYTADSTVTNDDFMLRVRRTTALTGTQLHQQPNFVHRSGLEQVFTLSGFWVATADIASESFFLSIQRVVGTGTIDLLGDGKTQFSMWVDPPSVTDTQKVT